MSRPHEDIQRHTLTDHRPGGPPVVFSPASWWAIAIVHVAAERADAALASYETLIEKAHTSAVQASEAAVLVSRNRRRVIALLHLNGHEAFGHLSAAWDAHHLVAERHAAAESSSLALYRLATEIGDAALDPASTDGYAFEHVSLGLERARDVLNPVAEAAGFRSLSIFGRDDDRACALVYRFEHVEEIEALRAGETFYPVHVVRTFA